jgi:hypothetical protein
LGLWISAARAFINKKLLKLLGCHTASCGKGCGEDKTTDLGLKDDGFRVIFDP